ncbi:MAG: SpoIIE family protein phosphatase, partial [Magnetococcales bacterium]|nr:SpoIIE family protein phosphatase [Magnetococcales bacterium]
SRGEQGWYVPVIFLTSVQTDRELARCLECGGDDFLNKPPNPIILKARIKAWLQRANLVNRLASDRQEVEEVILKMRQDDQFNPHGLRVMMTPLEKTNGDIVLSACRADGVQHLMVGDFTGHGLAAAICGPLAADSFYRMTRQDLPLATIIEQINATIFRRLPPNMFLASAFLELNRNAGTTRVWNANLPPVLMLRSGKIVERFGATLPPLGIRKQLDDTLSGAEYPLEPGDRIYLYSDGSVETRSSTGDFFGEERMGRFLEALHPSEALESLLPILETFRAGGEPSDDITLVEVAWS